MTPVTARAMPDLQDKPRREVTPITAREPDIELEPQENQPSALQEREVTSPLDLPQDVPNETANQVNSQDKIKSLTYVDYLYARFCAQQDLPLPHALESEELERGLGLGRVEIKGVPVPPVPEPYATKHEIEFELAELSLGEGSLVPAGAALPGNDGSTAAAHSMSQAAPERSLVVCQSPVGEGIGKPRILNTNPQWKKIANWELSATLPPLDVQPNDVHPPTVRDHWLAQGLRGDYPQWWLVLLCLLAGVVWPAASYVISAWDCANPTHVTAYNRDRMCE